MRIALLTCAQLPEPDPDESPLLEAFAERGHRAESVVWDDPDAAFHAFDALLLRATWDYAQKAPRFVEWLGRPDVAGRLWNGPKAVRWNLHKGYLLELESQGIPIVPTAIIRSGDPVDVATLAHARGWGDIVVKPAVSAGSARTRRFIAGQHGEADAFVRAWDDGVDAIIQPYLRSVEDGTAGRPERAIVWINGAVTHVVEKSRRFAGDDESVRARPTVLEEERAFAERVITACGHEVLYARVDVMDDDNGDTRLSELELIEPSLFFGLGPGSALRYVETVEERLGLI